MNRLRINYLQHVPHEGPGSIKEWAGTRGHSIVPTLLYDNQPLPHLQDFDFLVIMGGSMSAGDEGLFPWIAAEKKLIREAIDSGKIVLGICLGSQLVSAALGARVFRNTEKEIGWFDIEFSDAAQKGKLFSGLGKSIKVFHWHGDTFELPENAIHLASSDATKNQAYQYGDRVLALQFHLEPTEALLEEMLSGSASELVPSKYVQTREEIIQSAHLLDSCKETLFKILDKLSHSVVIQ